VSWRDEYGPTAPAVAVNLSPRQLRDPDLSDFVAGLTSRHRMPPRALCVEITEGALLEAGPATEQALARLSALGVELDLDDFGTGYSSLSSLERFHVDGLKIDRTFVAGRSRNARAGAIVEAMLGMAHGLGVRATAEGVETPEQLDWIRGLGCQEAQGFLFAKPQPAEAFAQMLAPAGSGAAV
jgi:EAL domain-containing protein (putative c-di-GMP-specific phosphodiesterase class I)